MKSNEKVKNEVIGGDSIMIFFHIKHLYDCRIICTFAIVNANNNRADRIIKKQLLCAKDLKHNTR